ncbi:TIGR01459 family HAD-type hydrolase [Roseospirillum parvum]|uniref:HAD-superfamily class IIA hydrolase, TIGR01459 n=1 Tax=Roseospirillum parvum TaxID=83401 RepID=A0A1G7VZC0_9PROT|nr:TIGR01459 family HAD-type hydrolase [Roseospirillum parvum]SDG65011.1 HAD-superfamily class IIA hydrolase, TIGR01459 [Roseospirillum parvum]
MSRGSATLPVCPGIGGLLDGFDGLILDLWGVIHDGHNAYPDAAATLKAVQRSGRRAVMLSNAPRRAGELVRQLADFGIPEDLYHAVLSSGEAVYRELSAPTDAAFKALGRRLYHLGPPRDRNLFEDLEGYQEAPLETADFILNTGPWSFDETVADYEERLQAGAARRLPMVCANPDQVVIRAGRPVVCAGALARRYQELDGQVIYRGKPDPAIYAQCLDLLGLPAERVAVVGDAFETDVKGAQAAGLAAIWCTGGIHAAELGISHGTSPDPAKALALAERFDLWPLAAIPAFRW